MEPDQAVVVAYILLLWKSDGQPLALSEQGEFYRASYLIKQLLLEK